MQPITLLFGLLVVPMVGAQEPSAPAKPVASAIRQDEEKGTYLGLLFGPVSEALYEQLPQLPRNQGVLVTHVLPDSPAARASLRRFDILIQYQDQKIHDCDHLARLIQSDKPDNKVQLTLVRAGKQTQVEVTLALGPVLRIAALPRSPKNLPLHLDAKPGIAKPAGGPATVRVSATPLEPGKMKVAIEFYQQGTGRLRTVVCQGADEAIDSEVKKLPEREQTLVKSALRRLRELNLRQTPEVPESNR